MGAGAHGVIRRDNPAARLHKQRIAKGLAQTVQGMADCRLADAQPNRGSRNAALIQHGNKRGQRPQVNIQYINGFHGSKFRAGLPLSHRCKNRNAGNTKISKAKKESAKAGSRGRLSKNVRSHGWSAIALHGLAKDGQPRTLSATQEQLALRGGAQASQGCAVRSVFWKAYPCYLPAIS